MKIYSMTATFGKLEHETLTLQPGLNVIHAPNEWGKSTWCAFLSAMLYGFETRARSTQAALSDKDHYTPWSGAPMAGRIDLNWQGRDITIERRTKGRSIFGDFKAYETRTGLAVPELTAANCGQILLGVEKSVFTRSAFVRLTDMPVTQDEALRHRLNTLVTTGDESGAAENLERKLKDLRNRCRYNRSGLLPQAEAEAAELRRKRRELEELNTRIADLKQQQTDLERFQHQLENHRDALAYDRAKADARQVDLARQAAAESAQALDALENRYAGSIPAAQAKEELAELALLEDRIAKTRMELRLLSAPARPEHPIFGTMDADAAREQVNADVKAFRLRRMMRCILLLLGLLAIVGAVVTYGTWPQAWIPLAMVGAAQLLVALVVGNGPLPHRYGSADPKQWLQTIEDYVNLLKDHAQATAEYEGSRENLTAAMTALEQRQAHLCGDKIPEEYTVHLRDLLAGLEALEDARRENQFLQEKVRAMADLVRPTDPPKFPDELTFPEIETTHRLADTAAELRLLQRRLGQCQGQMEAIGRPEVLEEALEAVETRLRKLEDTYAALTLALTTLETARDALQRRFAPKIAGRAQELLAQLTQGRYDRLVLTQDLSLQATAREEDTLRNVLWRSDGTVDQLYLALRLAVAGELIPQAPLVLDDALVRFDDDRLAAAMAVLKEEAQSRQVLVFTCQKRELEYQ